MSLLAFMLMVFALLHVPLLGRLRYLKTRRAKARVALSVGFLFTGSLHFLTPDRFVAMIPPFLLWHLELVYLIGFFELAGAVGLQVPKIQRAAGWGLAALLVAVFPANVYVAVSGLSVAGLPANPLYYWFRLPIQAVFIWWALWCSKCEMEP